MNARQVRAFPPRLATLAAACVVVASLKLGRDLIVPFALAFVVSFVLAPLAMRLERLKLGRVGAAIAAVLIAALLASGLVWLLFGQLAAIVDDLPQHGRRLAERVEGLRGVVGERFQMVSQSVAEMTDRLAADSRASGGGAFRVSVQEKPELFGWVGRGMGALFEALGAVGVVALLTTLMLLKRDDFRERFLGFAGGKNVYRTSQAIDEASRKVGRYLFIYTLLNGIHGVLVGAGLWLIGVPNAPLWGLLSALLRFIPYLGPWIAAIFPILLSFAASPDWTAPLLTFGLFLLLETVSNNVFEPLLYGSGTGVSSAAILMTVVFWTWLWGPVGLVVATPLTVVLAVMGKYVPGMSFLSALLSEKPLIGDDARLYQKLLAGDQDGAADLLEPLLADRPLLKVYDDVVLPALKLAADDHRLDVSDDAQDGALVLAVRQVVEEIGDRAGRRAANEPGPPSEPPPAARPLRAVFLPARDALDETVGALFAQVAALEGVVTDVASNDALSAARVEYAAAQHADVVLISSLSSSASLRRPRYFAQRLAERAPGVPRILCLWGSPSKAEDLRRTLGLEHDAVIAHTLEQALQRVLEIRGSTPDAAAAG